MNRSSINSASLGVGYSTAVQYFSAQGLLQLIQTTKDLPLVKGLAAAGSLTLSGTATLGRQLAMAAQTSLFRLLGTDYMRVWHVAPLAAQQRLGLSATAGLTVKQALSATGALTFSGDLPLPYVLTLQFMSATGSLTLTGTLYSGPRTPAPAERTCGLVDLSLTPRLSSPVALGA